MADFFTILRSSFLKLCMCMQMVDTICEFKFLLSPEESVKFSEAGFANGCESLQLDAGNWTLVFG